MTTSVKFISSTMRGAPTINGTAGSLISAFDTHFLTGHGAVTPLSITVSGGVATAVFSPGDSFDLASVVLVSGGTPAAINGEARILSRTNTGATWATAAADGSVTGSVSVKYAPQADWVKAFAGTNKAAYKSTHVQASGHFLGVDDTTTTFAAVRGYESMTDVATGVGVFPTPAVATQCNFTKSALANSAPAEYRIFSDERFFIFANAPYTPQNPNYTSAPARGFGDAIALAPGGDVWGTIISGHAAGANLAPAGSFATGQPSTSSGGCSASPRSISGLGSAVLSHPTPLCTSGGSYSFSGADTLFGAAPSEVDGEVKMVPVYMRDSGTSTPLRIRIPGIYYVPQTGVAALFENGALVNGTGELAGRMLMAICNGTMSTSPVGMYFVDVTGPWRD